MLKKRLFILLVLLLIISGCSRLNQRTVETAEVQESMEDQIEASESVFSTIQLDMDNDDALETLKFIDQDDHTFRVVFSEISNESEGEIEFFGKINSISQIDITNDGKTDVFISADEGGSAGSMVYYYLTYEDNELQSTNLSNLIDADHFSFVFNERGFYVINGNAEDFINYSDTALSTLKELDITVPTSYELFPSVISISITQNHEVMLTAKRTLSVEHKLNQVAEIVSEYVNRDVWIRVNMDVIGIDE